jgi:hypothetical protein
VLPLFLAQCILIQEQLERGEEQLLIFACQLYEGEVEYFAVKKVKIGEITLLFNENDFVFILA